MSVLRFALVTAGLFALAFIGVSWAKAGFPVLRLVVAELKPNPNLPTFEQRKAAREQGGGSKTNQSDGYVEHNNLRRELQQASTEYKMSPCNSSIRTKFVDALSQYVTAFHTMAFCQPGVDGCPSDYFARLDRAAAPFKTPPDKGTQEEVRTALVAAGGVSPEDFPTAIRPDLFRMFQISEVEFNRYCRRS